MKFIGQYQKGNDKKIKIIITELQNTLDHYYETDNDNKEFY